MNDDPPLAPYEYRDILEQYLRTHSEQALYHASLLSREYVQGGYGPEDIVALHMETLAGITQEMAPHEQIRALADAQQFLLEMMIGYGVQYKDYLELKLVETARQADQRVGFERERSLEAERVGRERGEILAMAAHELRTPITAAQVNLELIDLMLTQGKIDRVPEVLVPARDAVARLSRLTADLIEASREGLPTLEFAQLDLGAVIAQACSWVQSVADGKSIKLIHEQPGEVLPVSGNADGLLSVLGNLLSNAVRYTPAGGRITVRQGQEQDAVWVEIEDTGIGMSADTQQRMFEKFYRGVEARQVEAQGLGLGLALVQQVVAAHQGEISIASALGQGTTVRITLPVEHDPSVEL